MPPIAGWPKAATGTVTTNTRNARVLMAVADTIPPSECGCSSDICSHPGSRTLPHGRSRLSTRPRVMIADDYPDMVKAVSRILAQDCDVVG